MSITLTHYRIVVARREDLYRHRAVAARDCMGSVFWEGEKSELRIKVAITTNPISIDETVRNTLNREYLKRV